MWCWLRCQATDEAYDDFESVMRKLELSAASLAEVAASRDRNVGNAAGQSHQAPTIDTLTHCIRYRMKIHFTNARYEATYFYRTQSTA